MRKQTLKEAIIQKLLKIPTFQHQKESSTPCPKCGQQTIICCHSENGLTDYYDDFLHICLNPDCDYVKREGHSSGLGQEYHHDHLCPFCKRDVYLKK